MIKPARIQDVKHLMKGQKGWIVHEQSEFDHTMSQIPIEAGMLLMQEIVPGPESNIMLWCGFIDSTGEVLQRFTARKLRQYPAGFGSASLVQSETCTETSEAAEGLLKRLGYQGIAAAEFKKDPVTHELKIIEINPRASLWFSISTAAGIPLIGTAVAEATGTAMPAMIKQIDGVRWRYGLKDVSSKIFYIRRPDFVLPAPDVNRSGRAKKRADVVWTWNDPMPVVGELVSFILKGASRVGLSSKVKT
ncbi:MAG: ATP-grasp domain-containing protein [Granulosicoccus sp.]